MDPNMPPDSVHETIIESLGKTFDGIDPTHVTNQQLYMLLYTIRAQQIVSLTEIRKFKTEFSEYKQSQTHMMETWQTSKNVIRFIKALAAVGAAVGAVGAGIILMLKALGYK